MFSGIRAGPTAQCSRSLLTQICQSRIQGARLTQRLERRTNF